MGRRRRQKRSDDYYMYRMANGYQLARWTLVVIGIAVLYIPIHAVVPIAHELAGKNTDVTASISISVVISLGSLAGVATTMWRSRNRSAELERLRGRVEVYEQQDRKG